MGEDEIFYLLGHPEDGGATTEIIYGCDDYDYYYDDFF